MAQDYKKYSKYDKPREERNPFDGARIPPQNIDAEKALLGAIIISPEAIYEIVDLMSDDSFYVEKHRIIWKAITELVEKKEPVDLVSLNSYLKKDNNIDRIGGAQYLVDLSNTVGSAANIKYYALELRKKQLLRRLIEASTRIADKSFSEKEEVEHILEEAEKEIFEITSEGSGAGRLIHLGVLVS